MAMTLDDLRRAVELLPEGSAVTLPREVLRAALGDGGTTVPVGSTPTDGAPADEWLTAEQIAERFNLSPRWCYDHRKEIGGKKLSRRCTRFSLRAVEKYLARKHD
jgi:hypothetical protein